MTHLLAEAETPVLSPHGSAEFNASLWYELKYLANDVAGVLGNDLIAVVLGGGFGRAEGCVWSAGEHEMPYNDVDLFLITRTARPKDLARLRHLSERYEHRLGVAVDFSRPQTPAMIAKWKPLLMWQELANGHLVLHGDENVLRELIPTRVTSTLPLVEASRLLLNRAAGLVWAARVGLDLEPEPDETFMVRNYFKCAQALGDATLIALGEYCSDPATKSGRLRHVSLQNALIRLLEVPDRFRAAMQFRHEPSSHYEVSIHQLRSLAEAWCQLFLWVESLRSGRDLASDTQYIEWSGTREPGENTWLTSLGANLRRKRLSLRHPRECVYPTLLGAMSQLAAANPGFDAFSSSALMNWREAQ